MPRQVSSSGRWWEEARVHPVFPDLHLAQPPDPQGLQNPTAGQGHMEPPTRRQVGCRVEYVYLGGGC
jgi:hypothetical protein